MKFYIFLTVNKSDEKKQNQHWIAPSIVCLTKAWYSLFFCAIDVHSIKKKQKKKHCHTVAVGDMFLHCSLFLVILKKKHPIAVNTYRAKCVLIHSWK